jgi:hypothetical protein
MANDDERARLLKLSRALDKLKAPCELCGRRGAIGSKIHLSANAAFFVTRTESHLEGNFCGPCIHRKFIGYTITNVLFGWWGVVSLVKTPGFILSNCAEYGDALKVMWRRRKERQAEVDRFLRQNGSN